MVSTAREDARKDHDTVQRRNEQLKTQLADTESLLKSHQEQLAELKLVMEQMTEERDDQTNQTAPSTPGVNKFDGKDETAQVVDAFHTASIPETMSPSYPTSFTHLLCTVLRTDLSLYEDFTSLLRMSKNVVTRRVSTGSTIGLGGHVGHNSMAPVQQPPTNGSTSSLSTPGTFGSSPATPTTPSSAVSTGSTNAPNSLTPLKETRFYKRALAEDIEPTLRLDTAPGLSWLARRTVLNAVCEGTLVVEPMPATKPTFYVFACSLCGETRKDPAHTRSHRFRTSENDNAQRYPLCKYCLGRVRSTCDFVGFLRVLKDGLWKADDEESEKAAWEESVRLRDQMFWCRIGGGVIPAHSQHSEALRSPRASEDERRERRIKLSEELERTGQIEPRDVTLVVEPPPVDSIPAAVLIRTSKSSDRDDAAEDLSHAAQEDSAASSSTQRNSTEGEAPDESTDVVSKQDPSGKHETTRDSIQSTSSLEVLSPREGEKDGVRRLSITIPGSFEES